MGWKNVRDNYKIGHIIQVTEKGSVSDLHIFTT